MPRRPYSLAMDREQDDRFADVGPVLAARGWAPIPVRAENRVPFVKWEPYNRTGVGPDVDTVIGWGTKPGRVDMELANTALLLGRTSQGAFGLDIDTDTGRAATTMRFIANDYLGKTRFIRRTKSETRTARLYRIEHLDDLVTRRFDIVNDVPMNAFELLGNGGLLTAYGHHSRTDSAYGWEHEALGGAEPLNYCPHDLPVVTGEQIEAFLAEVHKKLGIRNFGASNASIGQIRFEKRGDIRVPHIPTAGRICDAEGRVVDGREGLLFDISRLTVRGNPHAAADEAGQAGLRHAIYEAFCERAITHTSSIGGKRVARYSTDEGIRADIADKVHRMCRALGSAPVQPIQNVDAYARKAGGTTKKATVSLALANKQAQKKEGARTAFLPIAALGEWLAPAGYATRAVKGVTISGLGQDYVNAVERGHDPLAAKVIERAIPKDVRETSARVTRETATAITSPLIDLLTPDAPEGVTIVRGLPGTGKTTTLVKSLADLRLENGAPLRVLMLAPAHRNLAEIADAARAAGLVVRVLRGRGSVCTKPIVAKLEAVGVSPGGACAARTRNASGELVRVECPTRSVCPAYTQYADLDKVDLILAPHAYLTMTMDKAMRQALQMVRAVVVDEGFTSTVLDAASFPLSTLRRQRVAPPIYKVDAQAGWTAAYLLAARNRACDIALTAFADDADLAARFADLEDGEQILHGAIATSSRGDTRAARVDPSSDVLSLAHILDAEETHGREEARMWRIVDERRRQILAARDNTSITVPSHEARIRIIGDTIRLAWRADIHFQDRPWLCLDGSADEAIVGRILGRPVRTVHVRAPLRQHVTHVRHTGLSGTALRSAVDELGRTGRSPLIEEMAELVAQVARQHRGEVLVVVRGAAEEALKAAKRWPDRVRFGHHNGLRGLNEFEKSEAVVILGSILPSPDALDDLAAALSYDDADPEPALVGRDGTIAWVRTEHSWPMRDGSDASAEGPGTKGVWHERMLRQLRDEDLVQNAARGRQVHRTEPMALYLVGDHVPAGTVVDLVVTPKTVLYATPAPKPKAVQKPKLRVVA